VIFANAGTYVDLFLRLLLLQQQLNQEQQLRQQPPRRLDEKRQKERPCAKAARVSTRGYGLLWRGRMYCAHAHPRDVWEERERERRGITSLSLSRSGFLFSLSPLNSGTQARAPIVAKPTFAVMIIKSLREEREREKSKKSW